MVGRDVPLRQILDVLGAAPGVVLISGEAGIGKTRLVSEVEASAAGFTVLHGECVEFGGEELALGPVVAALRGEPLPSASGRGQLFELLLERLGDAAPVLLVLEDVHWADAATLALLAFLARNLRDERVVVIATHREDSPELQRLAAELGRRRTVTRIALPPLTADQVARQLEAIADAPVPVSLAAELHARTGGNPFFVEELFAARTGTLEEAVLARIERLDQPTLRILAAAGGHATHELLTRLEIDPSALRAALDAGVLVQERDGVAFRHGLIGEVIYGRLLPGERTALHGRIAAQLHDAPAALRAHQYQRAGLPEEALQASIEAGSEAAGLHAYDAALAHYERALELGERSADLLARAAQAARFSGDAEKAVALCREAIALTEDPLLYERLGEYHFWDDEAALASYERALELAPGEPRLLAAKGHALMGLRRWEDSRACCEAGLAAGAKPRITLGLVLAHLGEADQGEAYLREALALAADGEDIARAYMHLGELLRIRGDRAGALRAMEEGERQAARLGLRGSFGHFLYVNAADDLFRLGRWDEAAARLEESRRMDLSKTAVALRRAVAGQLHTLRGDLAAARAELEEGDPDLPSEFLAPLAVARALLALALGDRDAARVHLDGALAGVQDSLYTPPLYSLAVRAEADPGQALAGLAALAPLPDARAHRLLAHAEHERTPAAWAAAAEAFDALSEPYPAAYARAGQAEALLLAGGERAAATAAAKAAHATAARLGARPLLEQVEALARRGRLDLTTAPVAAAKEDGVGLTAREIDVLRLLAEGLTNREIATRLFISQKTVGAHMAHIYAKLGVHSRVEAAGRAQRLGVLTT